VIAQVQGAFQNVQCPHSIRIVTWNSTGENLLKAQELQNVTAQIAAIYPAHPDVDVFLIQEAMQAPGGAISQQLNVPNYNYHHLAEHLNGTGAGYICATRAGINVITPLTLLDYGDLNLAPNFLQWVTGLNIGQQQQAAHNAANGNTVRSPAYTVLDIGVSRVFLITWHAPLGPSNIVLGTTMPGNALIDAYLVLENSGFLGFAQNQVAATNGVVIIAGDLNTTGNGLARSYLAPIRYRPLNNFDGWSHRLDHILFWQPQRPLQGPNAQILEGGHWHSNTSHHDFVSARVTW
jgi:hypothetical protein